MYIDEAMAVDVDGLTRDMRMILHYEFVRLLSVEREQTARLLRYFELTKNPIDAFFATALLNSHLRHRWIRSTLDDVFDH
jgi:hypothetical protein